VLLLDIGLYAKLVIFLFFQQQTLETFGEFVRETNIRQHDFFDDNAVHCEFAGDDGGSLGTDFFAFG
jgi:hypothetical protein